MDAQVNREPALPGTPAALGLLTGLGAFALASCCVLPLALAVVGLGGAWLAGLGGLLAYQPYLPAMAAAAVAAGWFVALRRRAPCDSDGGCTRRAAGWATFGALALSTLLIVLAATWSEFESAVMSLLLDLRGAA